MNTNIYFSLFFGLCVSLLNAQSLTVTDGNNNVVNGDTVYVNGSTNTSTLSVNLKVSNISSTAKKANVKRYEADVVAGSKNNLCFGMCFTDLITGTSPFSNPNSQITIPANDYTNGFHAYHLPKGYTGVSVYRYVFFDMDNTSDSVYVDIIFTVTNANSVAEENQKSFSVYLNENKHLVVQSHSLQATPEVKVQVYDMFSNRVKEVVVNSSSFQIPMNELSSGVYLLHIQESDATICTKKIVIE